MTVRSSSAFSLGSRKKKALCDQLLREREFDLICVVFGETHTGAHQLWKYSHGVDGSAVASRPSDLSGGIRKLYQATDAAMGALLEHASADANVFVVSSVGMKSQYPAIGLGEAFCRELGYQAAPRPANSTTTSPMTFLRRALPAIGTRSPEPYAAPRHTGTLDQRQVRIRDGLGQHVGILHPVVLHVIPAGESDRPRAARDCRSRPGIRRSPRTDRARSQLADRSSDVAASGPICGARDRALRRRPARDVARSVRRVGRGASFHGACHPSTRASCVRRRASFIATATTPASDSSAACGPLIQGRGDIGEVSLLDLAPTFLHLLGDATEPRRRPHPGIVGAEPR